MSQPKITIERMTTGRLWVAYADAEEGVTVGITTGETPDEALRKLQDFAALFPELHRQSPVPYPQMALASAIAGRTMEGALTKEGLHD